MSNAKLLLVEDEEIVAFDLEDTLHALGYEVSAIVGSGEEAIASATTIHPDLILMDILLQGRKNGIEAAKEIRSILNIPVVYLTAYADINTLQQAKLTEPFGYLIKPFQEKELQTTIEIALSRHQAEERMRQALQKEKEISELKSSFIAIASHEFRTPLATIGSSIELLQRYCQDCMDEKKSKHFQQIKTSINQINQLLDDVLVIGKSDTGKLQFKPVPLDLVEFCSNLVEELQQIAGNQHRIVFNSKGQFANACMDKNLLRQILTNLITNAVKYSPNSNTVLFELSSHEEIITFRIQDKGIGISLEDQKQLFEPFYRGTNVEKIKGTGLGLSIVKKCVDLHRGEIIVDSEVGIGTTFTVTLPLVSC
ncbi:MAG TPA: hybrid sensor histidine kinase/response regulator [Cyanobacteria bacterium UBA8543]|nr:hybrid sensor histidine kinase/response regulator [Cyanobacteria bacterium UBA8543]